MKTAVHFGAGKIGRGFIADLLHDSGYRIVFADVVQPLVDLVNREHAYSLFLSDHNYEEKRIDNILAYSTINEPEKVIEEIVNAEILTTSVMATNLEKVAPLIAKGLKARRAAKAPGDARLIVMACENAIMGTDILKKAMIGTGILTEEDMDSVAVFPNTAVDRMVFDGHHHGKDGVEVGDAFELPIEKNRLEDPESQPIRGAEYVDDLAKYLQRKIYMVNCGHAVTSYLGFLKGYQTVQESLKDPEILDGMTKAVMESASALEQLYGFTHEELSAYLQDMILKRYMTPGVSDPIARVAREPIRKISPDDRIMGPAIACEKLGLDNTWLLRSAAAALHYQNPEDAQAAELQDFIAKNGVTAAIIKYIGLSGEDRMTRRIAEEYDNSGYSDNIKKQ